MKKNRYLILYSCILALFMFGCSKYYSSRVKQKEKQFATIELIAIIFNCELTDKDINNFIRKNKKYKLDLLNIRYNYIEEKTAILTAFILDNQNTNIILQELNNNPLIKDAYVLNRLQRFREPKQKIELVEPKIGTFYNLSTAEKNGWLLVEELQSISYYYCKNTPYEDFKPMPKNPETINDEIQNQIKLHYWESSSKSFKKQYGIESIMIRGYYGTYNGLLAVSVHIYGTGYTMAVWDYYYSGVKFTNYGNSFVSLIKLK